MHPLFELAPAAQDVGAIVGCATLVIAGTIGLVQTDLKRVIAYSTMSQIGYMIMAVSAGAYVAGLFHLMTHAFFKALLFMAAGSVIGAMGGEQSLDRMGGFRKVMPFTYGCFVIGGLALAGVPPFSGFFSKDEILGGAWAVAGRGTPPGWPPFFGYILWGGLLIAALGTAFYMWRLYFLVFSGNERSEEAKHAHESPFSMTGVLAVLALFAAVIGLIGVPHLEVLKGIPNGFHALSNWLAPSVEHAWIVDETTRVPIGGEGADVTTIVLMVIALSIGALGIGMAWMLYGRGPSPTVARWVEGPLAGPYEASKQKLWFDEFYDVTIVRPFKATARGLFEIADRFVIDTVAVNGAAFIVSLLGRLSRWFQNGQVQRYLAGLVVGAAAVFFVTDCHRHPGFAIERSAGSDQIRLHAEPGSGLIGANVKLHWHLDGMPNCDGDKGKPGDSPDVTVHAGDVGAQVALCIEDAIAHKTTAVVERVPEVSP
jgi:NADH-quinone oxidoreductase subunit L